MTRFLKILIVFIILQMAFAGRAAAQRSVLAEGQWFRIAITSDGIYRIDYSRLRQLGLEHPGFPRIYGNNQGQLSYYNDGSATTGLREIPVYVSGNDENLGEGEYILFYAHGTSGWTYNSVKGRYEYLKHNYSDTAYYFLSSSSTRGKGIIDAVQPAGVPGYSSAVTDVMFVRDRDRINLLKSGRDWFERISDLETDPGFKDVVPGGPVTYNLRVAARSSVKTDFNLFQNSSLVATATAVPVNLSDFTGPYVSTATLTGTIVADGAAPSFSVSFRNNGETGAAGYLDYLQLVARREAVFRGETSFFSDRESVSPGGISSLTITSEAGDPLIWDVTDQYDVQKVLYSGTGKEKTFSYASDSLRRFMVFSPGEAKVPAIVSTAIKNQDLAGSAPADMIIVTHPLFRKYAIQLADYHAGLSGLETLVVTPEEIFNEFSGGIPDLCAIRNFVRMKYLAQKNTMHKLRYLLLFGDGSYENRTPPPGNPAYILTYQSATSDSPVTSFTSDDFFGLLDDGEGEAEGTEDIGIGRLPVSDTAQAAMMVGKIRAYGGSSSYGDWKNTVCLVADDEDGNTHLSDAEGLDLILRDSIPFITTRKIYLDAHRQETNASGQSYPDVTRAINDMVNEGCLIFNYTGHGNESGLAHEKVTGTGDINSWKNGSRLPLFITATCEFSRFDDMDINIISGQMTARPSAGEQVLLNPEGGAIALMSTTRLVYSAPNYTLNRNIFSCAFDRDETGKAISMGDIIRIAKNRAGSGPNKRNFTLLGDPALPLAWPWQGRVITDSLNGVAITENPDTLKALSRITVSGHIEDVNGTLDEGFNGMVSMKVFDKPVTAETLGNDGGQTVEFSSWSSTLFSGKTKAEQGRFRFGFIVPRDINYSYGNGRLSYYASDSFSDRTGAWNELVTGGFSGTEQADTSGPVIRLYLNDTLFRSGGLTDENPMLLAVLEDKGGINITGSSIGHDLSGYIDDKKNEAVNLNGYFVNDFDNFTRGTVSYNLGPLGKGRHNFTLKAWDNYNNSATRSVIFIVGDDERFMLRALTSYPNPFTESTSISAEHNRPGEELEINITVYRLDGSIVRILRERTVASGYVIPPVNWDGSSEGGARVGRGLYPYVMRVTTGSGETAQVSGRMVIL